jgi:mRNA-degrading endonuclease RelE of RelBE toxin-antitoxin system
MIESLLQLHDVADTGHGDVKRLKTPGNEFRLRVGQYRVIFESEYQPAARIIRILRVLSRERAYRDYD